MSFLKYFFYFLLLLFPLGNLGRIELGEGVNVSINDIVIFGFVLYFFVFKLLKKEKIEFPKATKEIALFVFIAFISLFWGSRELLPNQIVISGLYLFRWVVYALLYIVAFNIIRNTKIKPRTIYSLLILITAVIAILGLIQYIIYPDLGNLSYLGWDPHLHRIFIPFFDPIFTGAILVLGLIVLAWNNLEQKKLTWWNALAGILVYIAFALTYSRAAYFMFLVALIATAYLRKSLILFLIGILVFTGTLLILPERSYGNKLGREETLKARIENWSHAVKIIMKNPILGVGFNSYRYVQQKEGYFGEDWEKNHAGAGVDNSFLFILATTGIVGLVFYLRPLLIIGRMFKTSPILAASLVSLIFYSLTTNGLFYSWIMEWVWIILAVSAVKSKENK